MEFEVANIGIVAAFVAGAVSFLSPCVLPLVPGYVSYMAGNACSRSERPKTRTALISGCFVLGFSTVFILLGASATALSGLLLAYRYEANLVGGGTVIVFGIFTTGLVKIPWMERDLRYHGAIKGGEPLGAYVMGLAFGFGWTPCIGPMLGAILTISATARDAASGVVLLSLYSAGLGIPFIVAAFFAERLTSRLGRIRRLGRLLHIAAGVIMILMGAAMLTGLLQSFAFWLLQTFPIFGRIG
jgi:cytochrome c-type biogenesis protein